MADSELQRCPSCGNDRPIDSFFKNHLGSVRQYRKHVACYECRASALFRASRKKAWDWAAGLCKSTAMAVEATVRLGKDTEPWCTALDPVAVRVLYQLQDGKCAVTGVPLVVPEAALKVRETLQKWIETLPPDQAERTPVLVRVSTGVAWEPGSVVLISRMAEPIYRSTGSIGKALALMHSATMLPVPTADALRSARAKMEAVLYEEWWRERKRINDENRQNEEADKELEPKDTEERGSGGAEVP